MEMALIEMINNVGFPIAVSLILLYQLIKTNEVLRDLQSTIDKNTATMKRVIDDLREKVYER